MDRNLVFAGVGGQGVLLAANVVGEAATAAGYETRVGEIHGMSQRGGSVVAHVRYGDGIHGPKVPEGRADAMVALEPMEALRYAQYLQSDAPIILDFQLELPLPVEQGTQEYPGEERLERVLDRRGELIMVDASELARSIGNRKAANVVLVGALSATLELELTRAELTDAVSSLVPDETVEANLEAFDLGRDAVGAKAGAAVDTSG